MSDLADFLNSVGPIRTGTPVVEAKKEDNREKFSCFECAGTGIWKGVRVHQAKRECFACKGKGYFLTSPSARLKARNQAKDRSSKRLELLKAAYIAENPDLISGLQAISSWHNFAANLLQGFEKYGALTENQTLGGAQDPGQGGREAGRARRRAGPEDRRYRRFQDRRRLQCRQGRWPEAPGLPDGAHCNLAGLGIQQECRRPLRQVRWHLRGQDRLGEVPADQLGSCRHS